MKKAFLAFMLLVGVASHSFAQQAVNPCVWGLRPDGQQTCVPVNIGQSNLFKNISSSTTTLVKSGGGSFHGLTVNAKGSTGTVTIYDALSATGTKIATMTLTAEGTFIFDVQFSTGLTVVTTGAPDITVSYR